jgi:hypothetical protein
MLQSLSPICKKELLGVATGLLLFALLVLQPSIRGNDGFGNYVYIASILRSGDLDFGDDYQSFDELRKYPFKLAELPICSKTGRPTNRYGIGSALFVSPFVIPLHIVLEWHDPLLANTLGRPYEWAVGLATIFWGTFAIWLLYWRMRRDWPFWACLLAVLGLIFATPLGFYLYAHGSMSHGISFFIATCAMLTFERAWYQPKPAETALCGLCLALLVMTRFQDFTWAFVLGIALVIRIFKYKKDSQSQMHSFDLQRTDSGRYQPLFSLLTLVGVGIIAFLPQMIVWHVLYGSVWSGPTPYLNESAGSFSCWPRYLIEVLISERGGVIAWHPLFALGIAGLILILFRNDHSRTLAWVGLIGFISQLYLVASWSCWWGGASFGNRFFISSLPFLSIGMPILFLRLSKYVHYSLVIAGIILLIVWNMGLLLQYATLMVPREDAIPWLRVVKQNIADVPYLVWEKLNG